MFGEEEICQKQAGKQPWFLNDKSLEQRAIEKLIDESGGM
jgi:hypothetical protein